MKNLRTLVLAFAFLFVLPVLASDESKSSTFTTLPSTNRAATTKARDVALDSAANSTASLVVRDGEASVSGGSPNIPPRQAWIKCKTRYNFRYVKLEVKGGNFPPELTGRKHEKTFALLHEACADIDNSDIRYEESFDGPDWNFHFTCNLGFASVGVSKCLEKVLSGQSGNQLKAHCYGTA